MAERIFAVKSTLRRLWRAGWMFWHAWRAHAAGINAIAHQLRLENALDLAEHHESQRARHARNRPERMRHGV